MADAEAMSTPSPALPAVILFTEVALAFILAVRSPLAHRIGASIFLICLNIYGAISCTAGKPEDDYALGSSVWGPTTLSIILFTWLIPDPLHDIRYLKDPVPLDKKPILARMWYAGCIHHNWRLIGTNVPVANVPPPFKGTRAQYLLRRLRQICVGLVMLDISEAYMHSHLHLYTPGVKDAYFPPGLMGFLGRGGCMAVWLVITYTVLNMSYCVLSSSAVATCISDPADWPDLFGSLSDAYTVRRVWGRVWHQLLRRLAAHAVGAQRGSFLSSQAQIHGAFLSSAVLHSVGDLALGHGTHYLGNSFKFFLLNGAAVTCEEAAIALARRMGVRGPTRATYLLGYVWTAAWFTWAVRFYQEPLFVAGMGHVPTLPYSPTREVVLPFVRSVTGF